MGMGAVTHFPVPSYDTVSLVEEVLSWFFFIKQCLALVHLKN